MSLHIWCDQCDAWVNEVSINGQDIECSCCENVLLKDLPEKEQKKTRIEIAKKIWGL